MPAPASLVRSGCGASFVVMPRRPEFALKSARACIQVQVPASAGCARGWPPAASSRSSSSHSSTKIRSSRCCSADWYSSGSMCARSSCADTSSDSVGVRAQRVGGVAGDRDHLAAALAELAADLAQRRPACRARKTPAARRSASAADTLAGISTGSKWCTVRMPSSDSLQREGARRDAVLAEADHEHAAGVADRVGDRVDASGGLISARFLLGARLVRATGPRPARHADRRRRTAPARACVVAVAARDRFADRDT